MHEQQQSLQIIQAEQRELEQAVELAEIVGIEDAAERAEPVVPATIRFGDPALYELLKKQARVEILDEVIATLRDTEPAAEQEDTAGDEPEARTVSDLPYVSEQLAATMVSYGYGDVEDVAAATPEELARVPGIGRVKANQIITAAGGDPEANVAERERAAAEAEPEPETEPEPEPEPEPEDEAASEPEDEAGEDTTDGDTEEA